MKRALSILLLTAAVSAPNATAAPGDLDTSFSGDGWVRTLEVRSATNNYLPAGAEDVAVQPDGRIVAVGELIDGVSTWYFGAFRYQPDGGLDPAFGEGGWVDTDLGSFDFAHSVAVQPDGGIVVAGEGDCRYAGCFALARYRPDGSLDPSFGQGGTVRTEFGQVAGARAFDVAVAPDGRIVAAGFVQLGGDGQDSSHFAVARYLPDGRLDPSFSLDGRTTVDFGYGNDIAYAVGVQANGRVVAAGFGTRNLYRTESDFAFARFRLNGKLDRSFSGDGRRAVNFGGRRFDGANALAMRRGSILAAGTSAVSDEKPPSVAVVRLTSRGAVDRAFGRRRMRLGPHGSNGRAALIQPDGRVVVAGRVFTDATRDASDWAVLRLNSRGSLDRGFGSGDGIVITDFGTGEDVAETLAWHGGKILAGGSIYASQGLARYLGH